MKRILFVCLGNICRSPMAEFVFKDYAAKNGLSNEFHFESRATASWEQGNPVHPGTKDILTKYQIPMTPKFSQKIKETDFIDYDYIIAMDKNNYKFLIEFEEGYYKDKVYLYRGKKDVPDPYLTGKFEETFKLLNNEIENWFNKWTKGV